MKGKGFVLCVRDEKPVGLAIQRKNPCEFLFPGRCQDIQIATFSGKIRPPNAAGKLPVSCLDSVRRENCGIAAFQEKLVHVRVYPTGLRFDHAPTSRLSKAHLRFF
jgi:hypothetical protein